MIRKYKEEEIPRLLEIWEKANEVAHPFLDDKFVAMVRNAMEKQYLPDSDTWVYEDSGEIVGFISMADNEIGGLFVHPDHHAKGIGTALVHLIANLHEELEVEVFEQNTLGKPFYKKHGFITFKEYILEGADQKVLRMKKRKKT